MRRPAVASAPLWIALLLAACGSSGPSSADTGTSGATAASNDRPATLVVTTADGEVDLVVEVSDTADERERGLMHREDLAPLDGMAFVWRHPTTGSFWMKDTLIPLSIAFWDADGRIVAILDMEPCEADPCPTYDPGLTYAGAVEVEQGAFERHGITVGDRIELRVPETG